MKDITGMCCSVRQASVQLAQSFSRLMRTMHLLNELVRLFSYNRLHVKYVHRFLPRDAIQARPMPSCGVCRSVRSSVRLSRLHNLSKRINMSSKIFHRQVATPVM